MKSVPSAHLPSPPHEAARTAPPDAPRRGSATRRWLATATAAVLSPTPAGMRRIALAGVIANAGSIATGAAVRLSQSGLGCPTWPQCTGSSLVATSSAKSTLVHAWVEFGNRLFVTMILIVSVIVLIAAWRLRTGDTAPGDRDMGAGDTGAAGRWPASRRRLVWLAAVQPAGVALQAVLGGIVVLTKLNPVTVSIHFLASIAILAAAVALHVMFTRPAAPPDAVIRTDLRWLSAGLLAVTGLMLAAGTVVTGTGPLAGAASVPRYQLPLVGATQFHADIGWLLTGLTIAMVIALRVAGSPPAAVRRGWLLLGLILTQGVIGYTQYFAGLPAGLVWVHVLGATLVWIAALWLFFALHPRALHSRAQHPAAPDLAATAPAA